MKISPAVALLPANQTAVPGRPSRPFGTFLDDRTSGASRAFAFSDLGLSGLSAPVAGPGRTAGEPEVRAKTASQTDATDVATVWSGPSAIPMPPLVGDPVESEATEARAAQADSASRSAFAVEQPAAPPVPIQIEGPPPAAPSTLAGRVFESAMHSILGRGYEPTGAPVTTAQTAATPAGNSAPLRLEAVRLARGADVVAEAGGAESALLSRLAEATGGAKITIATWNGALEIVVGAPGLSPREEDDLHRLVLSLATEMGFSVSRVTVNGAPSRASAQYSWR